MADLDKALSSVERASVRDNEITRILQCNKNDHLAIMGLNPSELDDLVSVLNKGFKRKSLLIHPDKTDNKDAPAAFDRLRRSHDILSQETSSAGEKQKLMDIYRHVISEQKSTDADISSIRSRVAEILDEEARQDELDAQIQRKQTQKLQEEEDIHQQTLRAKRESAANWENQRESRVANWRAFTNKVDKKKKKKKTKVLA